jgi:hypothetical protein
MSEEEKKEDIVEGSITLEGEEVPTIDLGEIIDEKIASMPPAEKDLFLRILFLLNQSESYQKFIDDHFDIHTSVNHETEEIDLVVIEKPTVAQVDFRSEGFSLDVPAQLKATMLLKHNGCKNTSMVIKSLIKIITGEDIDKPKLVTSATDADINKEIETQKAASKILLD